MNRAGSEDPIGLITAVRAQVASALQGALRGTDMNRAGSEDPIGLITATRAQAASASQGAFMYDFLTKLELIQQEWKQPVKMSEDPYYILYIVLKLRTVHLLTAMTFVRSNKNTQRKVCLPPELVLHVLEHYFPMCLKDETCWRPALFWLTECPEPRQGDSTELLNLMTILWKYAIEKRKPPAQEGNEKTNPPESIDEILTDFFAGFIGEVDRPQHRLLQ